MELPIIQGLEKNHTIGMYSGNIAIQVRHLNLCSTKMQHIDKQCQ